MQYHLIVNRGTALEKRVPIIRNVYRVGRSSDADIVINNKNISALHFSIVLQQDILEIIDLDSTNGTFLNGKKVKKALLKENDCISIADINCIVECDCSETAHGSKTSVYSFLSNDDLSGSKSILQKLKEKKSITNDEHALLLDDITSGKRKAALFQSIYDLLNKIMRLSERKQIIEILLQELNRFLDLEITGLYIVDNKEFHFYENDTMVSNTDEEIISQSVLTKVLSSKTPVVLESIGSNEDAQSFKSLLNFKVQALLCFPIINRDDTAVGAFYCVSKKIGTLKLIESDRLFIKACSSVIALVFENMLLLEKEKERSYSEGTKEEKNKCTPLIRRLRDERDNLSLKLSAAVVPDNFFGIMEKANIQIRNFLEKSSKTTLPVLLTGETGVGKSLLAREIHYSSGCKGDFITIDCTTIPSELLESELFGHEKGSFTGAYAKRTGKIAGAENGTLFIDEIGDLAPALQGKLLRFIQTGEYEPLGSSMVNKSNARLITATNRDLRQEIIEKKFREDLYFRLDVLHIEIPPLRARKELIAPMADFFLKKYSKQFKSSVDTISGSALSALVNHLWPGNIRELENAIMRALVNCNGLVLAAEDLEIEKRSLNVSGDTTSDSDELLDLKMAREKMDRILIKKALNKTNGNVSQASKLLNISRNALMDLVKKYEIQ
jgi:transcriptional regulator with GAF, ATPase, and Fis domain